MLKVTYPLSCTPEDTDRQGIQLGAGFLQKLVFYISCWRSHQYNAPYEANLEW